MRSFVSARYLVAALLAMIGQAAGAQVFQGVALEHSSQKPVVRYPVALTRLLPTVAAVVSRTKTDASGLFQLTGNNPGLYRLEFGDSLTGITYGPVDSVGMDTVLLRQYSIRLADLPTSVLLQDQVDEPVVLRPHEPIDVKYPPKLLQSGVCGEGLVEFVVDTLGGAEMNAFHVLRSRDSLFSQAVRDAVERSRFLPARLHGRAVHQLVQLPFSFTIVPPRRRPAHETVQPLLPKNPFETTAAEDRRHPTCAGHR